MSRIMVISPGGQSLAVRLSVLLQILKANRQIVGYTVFDHRGMPKGPDLFPDYDVVIVHRWLPMRLLPALIRDGIKFVYDADKAILSSLSRFGNDYISAAPLRHLMLLAGWIMAPNERLGKVYAWHCGLDVPPVHVVPYAFAGRPPAKPGTPEALTYSSWNGTFLENSRGEVLRAIGDFASERGVPVLNFSREIKLFPNERALGGLDSPAFEAHLRACGPLLAVAPMETAGGPFLQDYVDCMSDLEKALYGSLGLPAVYSTARPYAESDLATGALVANDYDSWMAGLREAWERAEDPAFVNHEEILARRQPLKIAVECLLPVLTEAYRKDQIRPADLVGIGR